ncbi:MAG TPA: hypothetical protein VFI14_09435, partial [Chryseosolibacter sp.]|nr:hypothetical protein [Chryseosolibacter sp.]
RAKIHFLVFINHRCFVSHFFQRSADPGIIEILFDLSSFHLLLLGRSPIVSERRTTTMKNRSAVLPNGGLLASLLKNRNFHHNLS